MFDSGSRAAAARTGRARMVQSKKPRMQYPNFDKTVIEYVKQQGVSVLKQPTIVNLFGKPRRTTDIEEVIVMINNSELEITGKEHEVDFTAEDELENEDIESWQNVRDGG